MRFINKEGKVVFEELDNGEFRIYDKAYAHLLPTKEKNKAKTEVEPEKETEEKDEK